MEINQSIYLYCVQVLKHGKLIHRIRENKSSQMIYDRPHRSSRLIAFSLIASKTQKLDRDLTELIN